MCRAASVSTSVILTRAIKASVPTFVRFELGLFVFHGGFLELALVNEGAPVVRPCTALGHLLAHGVPGLRAVLDDGPRRGSTLSTSHDGEQVCEYDGFALVVVV